jgi:hypothetical protein
VSSRSVASNDPNGCGKNFYDRVRRRITIGNGVTRLDEAAFVRCGRLTTISVGVYFEGNAPALGVNVFSGTDHATVYYLAGTTGWWKPARTSLIPVGRRWLPSPSTETRSFSAIRTGRVIPVASTGCGRLELGGRAATAKCP